MHDILTVTLNPALDMSTSVGKVEAGPKLRCAQPQQDPGGGGVNVSRAMSFLGGTSRAFMALGGLNGEKLRQMIEAEGIAVASFHAPSETRISLSVIESESGDQYRFVMPGPEWSATALDELCAAIANEARANGFVVLSGSLPAGVPADFYNQVVGAVAAKTDRVVIDTSGAALTYQMTRPANAPYLLRMDEAEAKALAGRPLPDRKDTAAFARELVGAGVAQIVVIARGAEGSVLVCADQSLHVAAANVPVKSKVGAGDSFVAGMTWGLACGKDHGTALQWGAAAASAAVMSDATELCSRADFDAVLPQCVLSEIA